MLGRTRAEIPLASRRKNCRKQRHERSVIDAMTNAMVGKVVPCFPIEALRPDRGKLGQALVQGVFLEELPLLIGGVAMQGQSAKR